MECDWSSSRVVVIQGRKHIYDHQIFAFFEDLVSDFTCPHGKMLKPGFFQQLVVLHIPQWRGSPRRGDSRFLRDCGRNGRWKRCAPASFFTTIAEKLSPCPV